MNEFYIDPGYWLYNLYDGFFTDPNGFSIFYSALDRLSSNFPKRLRILEIGSGPGIIGQAIKKHLMKKGIVVELSIVDAQEDSLRFNIDSNTEKICSDNKALPFHNSSFDIICARSVLHYEESANNVKRVLEEVDRVLKSGGIYIEQGVTFNDKQERELFNEIHTALGRKMTLYNSVEYASELKKYFNSVDVIDDASFVIQKETEIKKRYTDANMQEIRNSIALFLRSNPTSNNFSIAEKSFFWRVPFSLYICKK